MYQTYTMRLLECSSFDQVGNEIVFCKVCFVSLVISMCNLVHDVDTVHDLCS